MIFIKTIHFIGVTNQLPLINTSRLTLAFQWSTNEQGKNLFTRVCKLISPSGDSFGYEIDDMSIVQ